MKPINQMNQAVDILFTDIDDTLTTEGRLPGEAYQKLWDLHDNGVLIVPVTGRPAGWCEMIARVWPVTAVIGENGAFYFEYRDRKMKRVFVDEDQQRLENQQKLKAIETQVLKDVPGAATASDQFCRLFDLAIDFCEDVEPLSQEDIAKIVSIFKQHGATAKVSSIHVNGWFGDYDKRTMCERFYQDRFAKPLKDNLQTCAFTGDSPNDEPLFEFFENSIAVANIKDFEDQLSSLPQFVSEQKGGEGFVEIADQILKNKFK